MEFTTEELDAKHRQLLKEVYPSEIYKDYIIINGTVCSIRALEFIEDILNFEVQDDDIWVCSYPKAGTTWTKEMVWLVVNDLNYEGAKKQMNNRFPFFEFSAQRVVKKELVDRLGLYAVNSIKAAESWKRPRFIQSHLPWKLLPLQIQNGIKKPKMFYVARNPKDLCTSFYHHSRMLLGFSGTFKQFCEIFLAGQMVHTPFWSHVLPFWEHRKDPNILFLKFEDMKKDLSSVIKTVCDFLGKRLDEKQMEKLIRHLSFDSMKDNAAVNYEDVKNKFVEGHFMRKGVVGSYREEMPDGIIRKFDEWTKENTEGTNLSFDV